MGSAHTARRHRRPPSRVGQRRPSTPPPPVTRSRYKRQQLMRRVALVWCLLLLAVLGLSVRLGYLQLAQGAILSEMAHTQQARRLNLNETRRPIVDTQGTPLAVDRVVYTLYGHPALFRQPIGVVAQTLAPVLDLPAAALVDELKSQQTGVRLIDDLSEDTARRIQQLRLDGLELIPVQQRFYPQQDLFSQVVGFINVEGEAQTGLEAEYRDRIKLPEPKLPSVIGPALPVSNLPTESAPQQMRLTLDSRLQRVAQEGLRKTLRQFAAKRGTVMVMDVHTGALRALAVEPTFDPNRYFDADLAWLKNWAITDLYEPGSTFKPINIAIALEAGAIAPDDTVYDEGQIQIGEWTIQNSDYEASGRSGTLSITEVLKYSSNLGMVHIMEQMPAADFYRWLEKLELDQPTGIGLSAENAGPLKDRDQFVNSYVDAATAAFGQGIVITPIKLLQLQAALANGGYLVTPTVVEGMTDDQGNLTWQPTPKTPKPVFSSETTDAVLKMMEAVVADGTGKPAQIPGYRIAGKTGTAQKVNEFGGYGSGRVTSFVSLLPVEQPRFVVLAVIDEPAGDDAYGSTVAAPLVKTVMESLVVLEGVPPSAPQALNGVLSPD
ncbi:peptidoglycan D,D-transpeptidase FtsI family protein [Leptolyngbya iicbica]|uniref:Penicillin-binding protein 2 n=2 Tax=Cyanophyceae TaxID=3028117 RepID=A0A4Q7E5M2_9CYAN|nr:penicillin-binding protein 2 [Leptolyngbya sp. LK]RZM77394.1 penicillin-binding protein 2 [Leptolyngbya sp. LK]